MFSLTYPKGVIIIITTIIIIITIMIIINNRSRKKCFVVKEGLIKFDYFC